MEIQDGHKLCLVSATSCIGTIYLLRLGLKPMRIATHHLIAPFIGASVVSLSGATAFTSAYVFANRSLSDIDANCVAATGLATALLFRITGGRFRRLCPSHLHFEGAFANKSLPAKGSNYLQGTKKRDELIALGRKDGCHTCGVKSSECWIADHQPPNALVKQGQKQRFFPQCSTCSNMQGGTLSAKLTSSHPSVLLLPSFYRVADLRMLLLGPLAALVGFELSNDQSVFLEDQTEDEMLTALQIGAQNAKSTLSNLLLDLITMADTVVDYLVQVAHRRLDEPMPSLEAVSQLPALLGDGMVMEWLDRRILQLEAEVVTLSQKLQAHQYRGDAHQIQQVRDALYKLQQDLSMLRVERNARASSK